MNLPVSFVSKPLLGLDWDARVLRIAHAFVSARSVRVDELLTVPIPGDVRRDDAESFGGFIREALQQARIGTKRMVIDVPRDFTNLYTLSLPAAPVEETAGMVAFRTPKELPFPVEQASVDFIMPTEQGPNETNDVLVAAVRNEKLDFYREVAKRAGLKLLRVGLRPAANRVAVNKFLAATPQKCVLFVDVGPTTTEIDVLLDGKLVFSRAADVAIPEEPEAEDSSSDADGGPVLSIKVDLTGDVRMQAVVGELMIEVTRSIEAYRATEAGATIDHAVIAGNSDIEELLAEAIQKRYGVTAQPYNPAACFGWDADRGADAGAFSACLGLILGHGEEPGARFDFLHPKRAVSSTRRRIKKVPVAVAAAVMFIAAGTLVYGNYIRPRHERRDALRSEISDLRKELKKHAEFAELVEIIDGYERERIVWIDELHDVLAALPDNKRIVLQSFDMSQKEHRIKMPFRAKAGQVGPSAVDVLNDFREEGKKRQQYQVLLGGTTDKGSGSYAHTGRLDVKIVDRDWASERDKKKKRRKRRP